jgi:maltooligosyltrehalose trehalohydrolase
MTSVAGARRGRASAEPQRRLPFGVELVPGGAHARVWAPKRKRVTFILEDARGRPLGETELEAESGGYFSGFIEGAAAGSRYRYRLDGGDRFPDPTSRFQPQGPHGPSEIVDPAAFAWSDAGWSGIGAEGQVLYELHIGTFTEGGTWASAMERLPQLAEVGVTAIEVMPVADFPGDFGWGYDGVSLFAPTRLYGRPDDFRRFVDRAHHLGLGVILDVVYNHLGPSGNYLGQFSDGYISQSHITEWGDALNFDGPDSGPVRDFFVGNAGYWVDEFHVDGLRLDATQSMFDDGPRHVLADIGRRVREAARGRATLVVAENEEQNARVARPLERGGYGLDALWNDDFHHSALVALTGRDEAYYQDHRGVAQEFVSAAKYGFLFQGQRYVHQRKRRGRPALDLPPTAFVHFLENHDQVANSARGERTHRLTSPGRHRALTAVMLLGPQTPMLFQGQEFSATTPFLYFADHEPGLAALVKQGRGEFLAQFPSIAQPEMLAQLDDPGDRRTFLRCRLDWRERDRNGASLTLHRELIGLRREDPTLRAALAGAGARPGGIDGAVLAESAWIVRFFDPEGEGDDRLLAVNLGRPLHLSPAPEPLLAPPEGRRWRPVWSTDDPRYGGHGTPPLETDEESWRLQGECAVLLAAQPLAEASVPAGEDDG